MKRIITLVCIQGTYNRDVLLTPPIDWYKSLLTNKETSQEASRHIILSFESLSLYIAVSSFSLWFSLSCMISG